MDEPSVSVVPRDFQKRVLPSRSRRGGPGVGNCDTDIMILETFKRQSENDPLISKDTPFFLTTDPNLAPPEASTSSLKINALGSERYFDRPEVIQGYREQQIIETPVFESISEGEGTVSRFRPRVVETSAVDTSDEAYIQRHRKYEKFEKRQRLREKEKLQHEQYKLRERVEQLRAMDYSAFLTLPASSFSPRPDGQEHDEDGQNLNGVAAIAEGERRKKEMLAVAESLEERYKILLPPNQRWRKYVSASTEGEETPPAVSTLKGNSQPDEGESEVEEKEEMEEDPSFKQPVKLKLNLSKAAELTPKPIRPTKKDKKVKHVTPIPSFLPESPKLLSPPPATPRNNSEVPPSAPSPMHPEIATLSIPDSDQLPLHDDNDHIPVLSRPKPKQQPQKSTEKTAGPRKRGRPPKHRSPSPVDTVPDIPAEALIDELASSAPESPPPASQPARKKRRTTIAVDESSLVVLEKETRSIPAPFRPDTTTLEDTVSAPVVRMSVSRAAPRVSKKDKECGLVLAAQNLEKGGLRVRRQRHHMAWGFKVPPEVSDMEMDFELPLWLLHDDTFQIRYSRYTDFKEDPKYSQQMHPLFKLNPLFVNGQRLGTPDDERLANALDSSHREHGADSQSEDSGDEMDEAIEQEKASDALNVNDNEEDAETRRKDSRNTEVTLKLDGASEDREKMN
ncbi:hypothetical protein EV361DRAFT_394246 [Lentinula raphanica]|uniref:PEHE domain-containing protein n=1 Tax=Lentinula raphanica TaxID=153919 RepID=A0AA38UKP2_9AGAR|nr:hypothetical protein F5878DRAFT_3500 [Lentinula raphanica]KAJ3977911.1 hypothetical protein EV361DRAFT_394246 [Lentinula raphanica]